jgi:hypothetical protein
MKVCFSSLIVSSNEMKKTSNVGPAKDVPIYRVYETVEMFSDIVCLRNCCNEFSNWTHNALFEKLIVVQLIN